MTTFAERIAAAFLARPGFVDSAMDEAQPLVPACDRILTGTDGMHCFVACIVDAEADNAKGFDPGRAMAKAVIAACGARFGANLRRVVQPASLVVVEVRRGSIAEARARLHGYSNRFFDRNAIHAFVVDAASTRVITATRFSGLAGWGWRRLVRTAVLPGPLPVARTV